MKNWKSKKTLNFYNIVLIYRILYGIEQRICIFSVRIFQREFI